jgi:hypothetical protein
MADYAGWPEDMLGNIFDGMMKNIAERPYWVGMGEWQAFDAIRNGRMSREDFEAWSEYRFKEKQEACAFVHTGRSNRTS